MFLIKPNSVFEVSWEVCNKVGGIYTVVSSKAASMIQNYPEGYFLVGPYFPNKARGNFEEKVPGDNLKQIFQTLKNEGIICHYGAWRIKGKPHVILIDYSAYTGRVNDIKSKLWEKYQIDSWGTDFHDFDEPIVWATATGRLIQEYANTNPDKKIVAHFHEWLSGAGLLYLKSNGVRVGKIFTTHATMLGRTLSANTDNFYDALEHLNPDEEAKKMGIQSKHLTEKASAQNSDVFTTVSEITGEEAEKVLGRKPDVLLPNGLDIEKFPTFDELSELHNRFKRKFKDFLIAYFFPYYTFDIEKTYLFYLCGRYEYKNKGLDVFIKSLSKLNQKLKHEKSDKTVVAFFWVPGNVRGIKNSILEFSTYFKDIKDSVDDEIDSIKNHLIHAVVSKQKINDETLFHEEFMEQLQSRISLLKGEGNPPLCTHDLHDEDTDATMNGFRSNGLLNTAEDRVKVIFYPIYLTGADSLLDTSYYESMLGCQLGVFPSYYEPWGYTPLESAALGVAALTTDFAGFGRYIKKDSEKENPGIWVVDRIGKSDESVVNDMTTIFSEYVNMSKDSRIKNKIAARQIASKADWSTLISHYLKAHVKSLESAYR